MLEPAFVDPCLNSSDVIRRQVMRTHELQHRVKRRMRATAAWVLLDPQPRASKIEGGTPSGQDLAGVVISFAIKDLEVALTVLESAQVSGEALASEQRGEQSVAGTLSQMQGFGHRAEIGLDATCKRCCNGER